MTTEVAKNGSPTSIEERLRGHVAASKAAESLLAYRDVLVGYEPGSDEEGALRAIWLARLDRALDALRFVDPVLFDGPLARELQSQSEVAAKNLTEQGVTGAEAQSSADALASTIARLASLPRGGQEARPLAHVTDEALELVRELKAEIEELRKTGADLRAQQERERETWNDQVNDSVGRFKEVIDTASNRVGGKLTDLDQEVDKLRVETARRIEQDRVAFAKAAEQHDADAEQLLLELRRKLSIAADESLSAGYGLAARGEEKKADFLRMGALATATIAGAVAVLLALTHVASGWAGVDGLPAKVVAVGVFVALSSYLARQSNAHRGEAWRLRQTELELRNLGEYLSELQPLDRAEVKRALVPRYFSGIRPSDGTEEGLPSPARLIASTLLRRASDDASGEASP